MTINKALTEMQSGSHARPHSLIVSLMPQVSSSTAMAGLVITSALTVASCCAVETLLKVVIDVGSPVIQCSSKS